MKVIIEYLENDEGKMVNKFFKAKTYKMDKDYWLILNPEKYGSKFIRKSNRNILNVFSEDKYPELFL